MTRLRVVALAQALTMTTLLLPGLDPLGPSAVEAARRPADPGPSIVYDAQGKGIGCEAGKPFRGPKLQKDPPWPPGAKPTPTPSPSPSPAALAEASSEPSPAPDEPEAVTRSFVSAEFAPTQGASTANRITGLDVSHHQGDIDFTRVRDAGHRFVIIKATESNEFIDDEYAGNFARARAAGLIAGAYHVFDYTLDGRTQADHFIERLEAVGGLDGALPPVVDVECFSYRGVSIQAVSAARLRDFVERFYGRTGLMPMIYTSERYWGEVVGAPAGFEELPLWTASWFRPAPPVVPDGWDQWTFWQVSNKWRVPGVRGNVDGNYFSGSRKDLRALRTKPVSFAAGAASGGGRVELDLGGRAGTHVRTSPDGETWSDWRRLRGTPTATIPRSEGEHEVYIQLKAAPGLKSPVFKDRVVVDATPPELSPPQVALRAAPLGGSGASIPVTAAWEARDATAGLADAAVAVDCGEGRSGRSEAPGRGAPSELVSWSAEAWVFPDATCDVTAIALDGAGNRERSTTGGTVVRVLDPEAEPVLITADQFGVIARRGPDGGRASVEVDGAAVALIDLYAETAGGPEVVFVGDLAGAEHVVAVVPTGSSDPLSDGTVVSIDGLVTLTR